MRLPLLPLGYGLTVFCGVVSLLAAYQFVRVDPAPAAIAVGVAQLAAIYCFLRFEHTTADRSTSQFEQCPVELIEDDDRVAE
jgi:hypothetical protein